MKTISPKLQSWWDWYSQPLSFSRAQSEWTWIQRVASETGTDNPVISVQVLSANEALAGYGVLAAGALAIHGGITQRILSKTRHESDVELLVDPSHQNDLKAVCLERLILESFQKGAELYQALVPIPTDTNEGLDQLHQLCALAGMTYLTRLVRMELPYPSDKAIGSDGRLSIESYRSVPNEVWVELLERTYRDSVDVPELTALRSTPRALDGYQANRSPGVEGWFVIRCHGVPAGCLILAKHNFPMGEISYLGLAPEFRSQGYSSGIMRFAMNWMLAQNCSKVALAVDCRNEVAFNVYQKWGFQATISYHAWVASPKTFQPSFSHSSS